MVKRRNGPSWLRDDDDDDNDLVRHFPVLLFSLCSFWSAISGSANSVQPSKEETIQSVL